MTVTGASEGGGHGLSNLHSGIAARAETMEGYRICAKCGVESFTQPPGFNSVSVISRFSGFRGVDLRVCACLAGCGLHPPGAEAGSYAE